MRYAAAYLPVLETFSVHCSPHICPDILAMDTPFPSAPREVSVTYPFSFNPPLLFNLSSCSATDYVTALRVQLLLAQFLCGVPV